MWCNATRLGCRLLDSILDLSRHLSAILAYSLDRLTSWAGTPLTYDANGNLTGLGSTTYTWNARNQLTATSAGAANFSYDALGRRTSATVNGSAASYLYDGLNLATISGSLMLASGHLDEIYAHVWSSGTTSYLRDGVNRVVAATNGAASVSGSSFYSPYGDIASSGTATPLQFTGRENDGATGLYYYRARYYSPQLSRFISEDPLGLAAGTNFYAYVNGNPISDTDPSGKFGLQGAAISAAFNLGAQIFIKHRSFKCMSFAEVGLSAFEGLITPGWGKIADQYFWELAVPELEGIGYQLPFLSQLNATLTVKVIDDIYSSGNHCGCE